MLTYRLYRRWIVYFLAVALLALASTEPLRAQPPFSCSLLSLSNKRLFSNQFNIDIHNDNAQDALITRVQITWPNIPSFAQTALAQMSLNTVAMWIGHDPQNLANPKSTTDTATKPGNPPFLSTPISIRTVAAGMTNVYAAIFSGPPFLASYVSYNQYAITITFDNPLNPAAPCVLTSPAYIPTITPSPQPTGNPTPTHTPTPDCAPGLIIIRFNSFDSFGIVRFDIINQRTTTSTLVGLNINWQKYVNSQRLIRISMDAPPGRLGTVLIWESGNLTEDATPSTNSHTEGNWLTNYTIQAGSVASIYLDFDGIYSYDENYASTNPPYGGASDFNFSSFAFTCGTTGGGTVVEVMPQASPTNTPAFTPTLMTPTSAPGAQPPRNFYSTLPITLTWNAVTWATAYELEYTDLDFDSIQSVVKILPATSLSYTINNLANGTYYWRVKALGGTLDNWSTVESFVVSAPPTPTQPGG